MKILVKLLLGFVSVALLCAFVGIVAISQVSNLNKNITMLADETIPALGYLKTIDLEFTNIKAATRSIAHPYGLDNEEYYKRQLANVQKARISYKAAREAYEKLPKVPEEARLYKETISLLEKATEYNNEVLDLTAKAQAATSVERTGYVLKIFDMIQGDKRLAFDNLIAALKKLIEFDQRYYGNELPQAALRSANSAIVILLVITFLAFVIAVTLGVILGRSISGSLRASVVILNKIAAGDMSDRLKVKSNDEFKEVAASLNTVAETINALVSEAASLSDAAVAGKLTVRGNSERFQGAYRDLVNGVNDVIDGLVGFLDTMPTPAMLIDTNYQILYMNKAGSELGGATGRDLVDTRRKCYDFFKTSDCKSERCACSQAMRIGGSAGSQTNATPLDKTYEIAYTGVPVKDRSGKIVGAFEVVVDQTAIKQAERKMLKIADFQNGEIRKLNEYLMKVAAGDLSSDFVVAGADSDTAETKSQLDSLSSALNQSLDSINDILSQVAIAVEQVSAGSQQVSQASQSLSQGATEQASSLEEITSSVTEISGQTRQNTENAVQVNTLAKTAKEDAEQGNVQMTDLVSAMSDINKSAEEIRKIVKAIDDISFQINLLALNANVEAARAGKYGKGFAVVAEEVRNLAVRSAGSVKETTNMVDEAIANISRGNELVSVTAKQLSSIVGGAGKVADLAEEVSIASREQSQGLEQISTGLNQIDQVTQSNTASAEQSASAAEELSSQAQQLNGMIGRFKLKQRESTMNKNDMLAMLRAELAREGGHAAAGKQIARAMTLHKDDAPRPTKAPVKIGAKEPVNPAGVISLDDDDFGKF
ncbi:MAG: methyl-accepting chemotaxis protein [Treponemataceae bacterium]